MTKKYGNYRALVVSNKDTMEAGRIQVRVFSIYDDLKDSELPWAIYADPLMGGDSDIGGSFFPDEGSIVWVFFEEGNIEQPVYFAGAPSRPDGPSEMKNGFPENRVFKTKTGHLIEIDDSESNTRIRIKHQSGTEKEYQDDGSSIEFIKKDSDITVEEDARTTIGGDLIIIVEGDCNTTVKGNHTEIVEGDYTVTVGGEYRVAVTDDVTITGSSINLN